MHHHSHHLLRLERGRLFWNIRKHRREHFLCLKMISLATYLVICAQGCALHYYDQRSGTEHVWGIGHLKMKASPPDEGVQAVVNGTETLGVNVGVGREGYNISGGWDYRRRIVVSSNASVRLEWPNGDFFNVRVGTVPPFKAVATTNSLASKAN